MVEKSPCVFCEVPPPSVLRPGPLHWVWCFLLSTPVYDRHILVKNPSLSVSKLFLLVLSPFRHVSAPGTWKLLFPRRPWDPVYAIARTSGLRRDLLLQPRAQCRVGGDWPHPRRSPSVAAPGGSRSRPPAAVEGRSGGVGGWDGADVRTSGLRGRRPFLRPPPGRRMTKLNRTSTSSFSSTCCAAAGPTSRSSGRTRSTGTGPTPSGRPPPPPITVPAPTRASRGRGATAHPGVVWAGPFGGTVS